MTTKGINTVTHPAERPFGGVGYVILSLNQDRKSYINSCYKNNTVSIVTSKGEVIKNCFVSHNLWDMITFPTKKNQRGSCVAWIDIPDYNRPVVIGILKKRDEYNEVNTENTFKFTRRNNGRNTSATIFGNGDKGRIIATVEGDETDEAQVFLRILNAVGGGLFDILIQGDMNLFCEGDLMLKIKKSLDLKFVDEENPNVNTKISYILGQGFLYQDEFGSVITFNKDGGKISLKKNQKVVVQGEGNDTKAVVLYDQMQGAMNQLNNLLQDMATTFASASTGGTYVLAATVLAKTGVWKNSANQMNNQFKQSKSKNFETS